MDALGAAQSLNSSSAISTNQRLSTTAGDAAQTRQDFNSPQKTAQIGQPIPIVFGRRESGVGGVWVNPPATEGQIQNDSLNAVSIAYELVLSDGEIGAVSAADVYQAGFRRGEVEFAYGSRAGTWDAGNYVIQQWGYEETRTETQFNSGPDQTYETTLQPKGNYAIKFNVSHTNISPGIGLTSLANYTYSRQVSKTEFKPEASFTETGDLAGKASGNLTQTFEQIIEEVDRPPLEVPQSWVYSGEGGPYSGMSMLSFSESYEVGDLTSHTLQVNVLVRNGLKVERLLHNDIDSSDLFPDLIYWLLKQQLGDEVIDRDRLIEAAEFCEAQGFKFNGVISAPNNVRDFLNRVAPLMLLTVTQQKGKIGIRPNVPTSVDGLIYVGPTQPRRTFTDVEIVADGFSVTYINVYNRKPFVAEMLWRQQPEGNLPLIRTTEVAYQDQKDAAAATGIPLPREQFDLTDFCTNHLHAAKVGASIQSRRRHVTHTASMSVRAGTYAGELAPGDVIEVVLPRVSSTDDAQHPSRDWHYYYQINSISTSRAGDVQMELTHWPVNEAGVSLVALDIETLDPGSVTTNPADLPQLVDPLDDLYDESYLDNAFATLTFTTRQLDDYWEICANASTPIQGGDLLIRLNNGKTITILEGETTGCVIFPLNDLSAWLDPDGLTFDDLFIEWLNYFELFIDGLDELQLAELTLCTAVDPLTLEYVWNTVVNLDGAYRSLLDPSSFPIDLLTGISDIISALDGYGVFANITTPVAGETNLREDVDFADLVDTDVSGIDLGSSVCSVTLSEIDLYLGDLGFGDFFADFDLDEWQLNFDGTDFQIEIGEFSIEIDSFELLELSVDSLSIDGIELDSLGGDLNFEGLDDFSVNVGFPVFGIDLNIPGAGLDTEGLDPDNCVGGVTVSFTKAAVNGNDFIVQGRIFGGRPVKGLGAMSMNLIGLTIGFKMENGDNYAGETPDVGLIQTPPFEVTPTWEYWELNPDAPLDIGFEYSSSFAGANWLPENGDWDLAILTMTAANFSGGYCHTNTRASNNVELVFGGPQSGAFYIVIQNSNSAKDDIFKMRAVNLTSSTGGIYDFDLITCNFTPDGEQTTFIVGFGPGSTSTNPLGGVVRGTKLFGIDRIPKVGTSFQLRAINIARNDNGNRGTVAYGWVGGTHTEEEWTAGDGQDWSVNIQVGDLPA